MSRPIGGVSFDAGGTLLEMDPPPHVIFAAICRDHGVDVDAEAVVGAYERSEPWLTANLDLYRESPEQFWQRGNRVLLEALGVTGDLDRLAAVITEEFPRRQGTWRLYPDVTPTLEALRARGLPLAVVSNWDPGLAGVLERLGIRGAFQVVVASAEAGVAKPHPEIFAQAVAALGTRPDETLHVGDLVEYDVAGARAAGLIPVLLRRRGRPVPDEAAGDVLQITSLLDLLAIVNGRRAAHPERG